jgi:hypothetical protein
VARAALDALEVFHGPAHVELVWTHERGPVLLELGARPNGGINAILPRWCGGPDVPDQALATYLGRHVPDDVPRLTRRAVNRFLVPPPGLRVQAGTALEELWSLPSCRVAAVRPGRPPSPSGTVGVVTLVHRHSAVVERDLAAVRRLEQGSLYAATSDLEPAASAT